MWVGQRPGAARHSRSWPVIARPSMVSSWVRAMRRSGPPGMTINRRPTSDRSAAGALMTRAMTPAVRTIRYLTAIARWDVTPYPATYPATRSRWAAPSAGSVHHRRGATVTELASGTVGDVGEYCRQRDRPHAVRALRRLW